MRSMSAGPNVGRTLETGSVLLALTLILLVTGLLISPTATNAMGPPFPAIQANAGNALYAIHIAGAAMLVAFIVWHLLPLRRAFSLKPGVRFAHLAVSHALLALVAVETVTGYALWAQDYTLMTKATAALVHLGAAFVLLPPLMAHAMRGIRTWERRRHARDVSLSAADAVGQGARARVTQKAAARRTFLRLGAYAVAGVALAVAFGRSAVRDVKNWRLNSVGLTPRLTHETWRLRITGLVEREVELTWDDLMALPQVTRRMTHHCVEGWTYTADWTGVRLSDVLAKAGAVMPAARMIIFKSPERSTHPAAFGRQYTTNFPYRAEQMPDLYVVHKADGADLPPEHGFPVRIISDIKWGYKACKWLTEIELSSDPEYFGYWERQGYHLHGDYPGPIFAGNMRRW